MRTVKYIQNLFGAEHKPFPRSAVTAMDGAKVSVLNCDFGQTELTETVVSCTGSDLTVQGCYLQGIQVRAGLLV